MILIDLKGIFYVQEQKIDPDEKGNTPDVLIQSSKKGLPLCTEITCIGSCCKWYMKSYKKHFAPYRKRLKEKKEKYGWVEDKADMQYIVVDILGFISKFVLFLFEFW